MKLIFTLVTIVAMSYLAWVFSVWVSRVLVRSVDTNSKETYLEDMKETLHAVEVSIGTGVPMFVVLGANALVNWFYRRRKRK